MLEIVFTILCFNKFRGSYEKATSRSARNRNTYKYKYPPEHFALTFCSFVNPLVMVDLQFITSLTEKMFHYSQ